jgi:hypothetical protein
MNMISNLTIWFNLYQHCAQIVSTIFTRKQTFCKDPVEFWMFLPFNFIRFLEFNSIYIKGPRLKCRFLHKTTPLKYYIITIPLCFSFLLYKVAVFYKLTKL